MDRQYSFCESVHASSLSPWHIRPLTDAGRKLGGGVDTPSLCGRVEVDKGWDLSVPFDAKNRAMGSICQKCLEVFNAIPQPEMTQTDGYFNLIRNGG